MNRSYPCHSSANSARGIARRSLARSGLGGGRGRRGGVSGRNEAPAEAEGREDIGPGLPGRSAGRESCLAGSEGGRSGAVVVINRRVRGPKFAEVFFLSDATGRIC